MRCRTASGAQVRADHPPSPLGAARPRLRPGPEAPCLCEQRSPALTSSLCVDGHFFRRRPQFSRFPVCRCKVRARARSAPAARLSVSMAAADGRGEAALGPRAGKEAAPQIRCPRPESRARGCPPREAGPRPALGPEGGPAAAERWPEKDALMAAAPAAAAAAADELTLYCGSRFLEDND